MGKTLRFPGGKTKSRKARINTAAPFFLCENDVHGHEISRYQFTGGEHIKTVCPECQKEHWLDIYEFIALAAAESFDFGVSSIYCEKCSQGRSRRMVHNDIQNYESEEK